MIAMKESRAQLMNDCLSGNMSAEVSAFDSAYIFMQYRWGLASRATFMPRSPNLAKLSSPNISDHRF